MKNVNNVNELSGKDWLKNAVNFWHFDKFEINEIVQRFVSFCYKDRTSNNYLINIGSILTNKSDFSFSYVKKNKDVDQIIKCIINGAYNSYHVVFFDNEFMDNMFLTPMFTKTLNNVGIEYRGKIVVEIKNENSIKYALLFLNRLTTDVGDYKIVSCPNISVGNYSSYLIYSRSKIDKIGLKHPAPYSYIDIENLCEIEGIKNQTILDPFLGVGSTIIGTYKNNRNVGIELNQEYIDMIYDRFNLLKIPPLLLTDYKIICGDSLKEVDNIDEEIDSVITSPPYFNILKNKTSGVRTDESQSRQGVEYYSDMVEDLGNLSNYDLYLDSMQTLFSKIKSKLKEKGKVYLVISDFTINKKETDVHSDFVNIICQAGYKYCGTSYFVQDQKVIYPFGYPYKIVLNHIFQYVVKFEVSNG